MAVKGKHEPFTTRGHIKALADQIVLTAEKLRSQNNIDLANIALTIGANIQPSLCDVSVSNKDGSCLVTDCVKIDSRFDPFKTDKYLEWLKDYLKKSKFKFKNIVKTGRHTYTFTVD